MLEWNKYAYPSSEITIRIVDILESYSFPDADKMSVDEIIVKGMSSFFDFAFPWYSSDNEGLQEFKSLFLHKYYMKQIGQETESLFKLNIQSLLMEKMPEWEEVFQTTKMTYDPLINRDLRRLEDAMNDRNKSETGSATSTSNVTGNSKDSNEGNTQSIDSDNPQVTVSTQDYASKMKRGQNKVTGTVDTSEDSSVKADSSNKVVDNDVKKVIVSETGFVGESKSDNILKYRKLIVNLNLEICEYLRKCFLMVY